MSIRENIELIRKKISSAADRTGTNPEEITIVAVSKKIGCEKILEAYRCGLCNFGENYAQEFRDKYEIMGDDECKISWHFIGHLQKNKIKYVIGKTGLIHSLDSVSLAEEINKRAGFIGIKVDTLIEINSAGEDSKTGIGFEESDILLQRTAGLENIEIRGFMTMAPYFHDPEKARPFFRKLREYRDHAAVRYPQAVELSMGMSGDYETAVEEGATIVRIGTAIFGPRE